MRMQATMLALALVGGPAWAETYQGKLDQVDVRANQLRFVAREAGLTLFATGLYQDVLLRAFFAKAKMTLDYQVQPCGGGTPGKCGAVHGVLIEQKDW